MNNKKKFQRKSFNLKKKMQLIREIENNLSSRKEIAMREGIALSTINTWVLEKEKIVSEFSNSRSSLKRNMATHYPEIESALLAWFEMQRSNNIPINGPLLKEKAEELAFKIGRTDFICNSSWISRFVKRNNISFCKMSGESNSVPINLVEKWLLEEMPRIMSQYSPKDIFNADETGLFYKCLPDKTYEFKGNICKNGKMAKERLTILLCASMMGEKRTPLVIGKFAKPRCFKNKNLTGFNYHSNKNSWMTASIFTNELVLWDLELCKENRKIVLLIDNASVHPNINDKLETIQLEFLPANTTSILQPMDQGIIQNFKTYYRKSILTEHIRSIDNKTMPLIDIFTALKFITVSWEKVKVETIKNCFKHSKIFKSEINYSPLVSIEILDEMAPDLITLNSHFAGLDFNGYCKVDEKLETISFEMDIGNCEENTQEIKNGFLGNIDIDEASCFEPKISDALDSIRVLSNYLVKVDFFQNDQFKRTISNIEEIIENEFLESKKKQNNLFDYGFNQNN